MVVGETPSLTGDSIEETYRVQEITQNHSTPTQPPRNQCQKENTKSKKLKTYLKKSSKKTSPIWQRK